MLCNIGGILTNLKRAKTSFLHKERAARFKAHYAKDRLPAIFTNFILYFILYLYNLRIVGSR